MSELIELAKQAGFGYYEDSGLLVITDNGMHQLRPVVEKFKALVEAKQAERIAELETKLYHAELAAEAEVKEVDKRGRRIAKLVAALEKAVNICEGTAKDKWALYKGTKPYSGHEDGRADTYVAGLSDGADICANDIRALINNAKNAKEALED